MREEEGRKCTILPKAVIEAWMDNKMSDVILVSMKDK